jgi:hypothetical protein
MYILFVTEMSGGALIKNGISKSGRERLDFFFFFCNYMDKRQIQGGGGRGKNEIQIHTQVKK